MGNRKRADEFLLGFRCELFAYNLARYCLVTLPNSEKKKEEKERGGGKEEKGMLPEEECGVDPFAGVASLVWTH